MLVGEGTRSPLSSHRFLLCLWQSTTRCRYGTFNPNNPVAGWGWGKNKGENLPVLCKMEFSFFLAACQANEKKIFFLNQHYELKRLSRNICTVKLLTPKKSNIVFILYKLKWKIKTHLGQCAKSPKQKKSTSEVNPFSKRWH